MIDFYELTKQEKAFCYLLFNFCTIQAREVSGSIEGIIRCSRTNHLCQSYYRNKQQFYDFATVRDRAKNMFALYNHTSLTLRLYFQLAENNQLKVDIIQ